MVIRLKARCKLNGIPFNLEEKDVRIPEVCPVLGIKISRSFSTKEAPVSRDDRPSLDRLVPSLGYVKGNVWVISGRANRLRNDATVTELRAIASAIDLRLFRMKSHAQITGSL